MLFPEQLQAMYLFFVAPLENILILSVELHTHSVTNCQCKHVHIKNVTSESILDEKQVC